MRYTQYRIGTPINTTHFGDTANFINRQHGCVGFFARPRYGKSSIAKHLFVKILNNELDRTGIVFDFGGEWAHSIMYPNWKSDSPMSLSEVKVVKNFTMKISELSMKDWLMLGFTGQSARWMWYFATKGKFYHKDIPEKFENMLNEVPFGQMSQQFYKWNENFPKCPLNKPLHNAVPQSIVDKYMMLMDLFWNPKKKGQTYIADWERFLSENRVIIFDLKCESATFRDEWQGHCTGYIMIKMKPYLMKYKPIMAIEEADSKLSSRNKSRDEKESTIILSSTKQGIYYAKKLPKYGAQLWLISQNPNDIHEEIINNITIAIVGSLDGKNRYMDKAKKLQYNLDRDYREFYYIDNVRKMYMRYVPDIACCNVETQGASWLKTKVDFEED